MKKLAKIFCCLTILPLCGVSVAFSQEEATPVKMFSAPGVEKRARSVSAYGTPVQRAVRLNRSGVESVLRGERKVGLEKLQEARKVDPTNATVLYNMAGVYLEDNKAGVAAKLMERAVEIDPNDLAFRNRLAEAFYQSGNGVAALEHYEWIVSEDPDYEDATLRLGVLYSLQKKWVRAEEVLQAASVRQPKDVRILSQLGSVLVVRKKYAEAIPVLERAQAISKRKENASALGIANEALGKFGVALQHFKEARALGDTGAELANHITELEGAIPSDE